SPAPTASRAWPAPSEAARARRDRDSGVTVARVDRSTRARIPYIIAELDGLRLARFDVPGARPLPRPRAPGHVPVDVQRGVAAGAPRRLPRGVGLSVHRSHQ